MKLTEKHTFTISKEQKQTLKLMDEKYHIKVSEFIRKAINEKLQREKETMFKNYTEIQKYLKKYEECPF